ncbi:DUF503 family protein [bacterium]|nr:DUF503 family protein [bacterium]
MRIAATRITMDFFNNTSASEKRKRLAELCENLRKQFNVSALEIDEFDDPEKCCEYIDTHSVARVTLEESDITAI